jgi:hypothetical protein
MELVMDSTDGVGEAERIEDERIETEVLELASLGKGLKETSEYMSESESSGGKFLWANG